MSVIAIPIGRTGKGTVALLEPRVQAVIDAGGTPHLIQDLPADGYFIHKANAIDAGYTEQRHDIVVEQDSLIARMLGSVRVVNSEHH